MFGLIAFAFTLQSHITTTLRWVGTVCGVRRATVDSSGARWIVPQYGFMPDEGAPATFTGYFYGAAGYGLTVLRLDGALRGMRWDVVLPDNPVGRVRGE